MRIFIKILSTLGLVLLISSILFFFFLDELSQDVRLVSASDQEINDDIKVTASIKAEHQYTLYSPAEGTISSLNAGDTVSKNQVLAKVDKNKEAELINTQSETRLRNLVSQYSLKIQQTHEELRRLTNAINAGVMPRHKLIDARSELQRANTNKAAAQDELQSYLHDKRKNNLSFKKYKVKALSNGIITKKLAFEGQQVRKGDPLFEIISTDNLSIKAMLSPQQVSKLKLGQSVTVSKQDIKSDWNETITKISPVISQDSDTKNLQEVTISLNNIGDIKTAINEKVTIIISSNKSNLAMSLPIEAIINDGKKFYILYVDKNKKASFGDIYQQKGFVYALRYFKCQLTQCNADVYGLLKKEVIVGSSNLDRVQIQQDLAQNIKIIIPSALINKNSLITVENNE